MCAKLFAAQPVLALREAGAFSLLGGIINLRGLFLALGLIALVLVAGYAMAKNKKSRRKKPGQHMVYEAPGKSSAACVGILKTNTAEDIFTYRLESNPRGGWYINLKGYRPTEQIMDTVYLLLFEGDDPARFTLEFVSEAFGMREPVVPAALVNQFMESKLGARPAPLPEGEA